ncbi:MAG TPA: T9SS type A sorting domain-containing protein, partial [Tenuifilaceae bacterium]|nr:T9SS type A sorting domain-containing protein [Tenuifilaceae bacterium]
NLYPNPASDYINISLTGASSEVTVRIFDVRGSMVKSQVLNASENRIDVSTLAKGIYMVSVGEGKEISTKRFIKQ